MNADIKKRILRAIAEGSQSDLDSLAQKVIDAERKTGHGRLADQLESILRTSKRTAGSKPRTSKQNNTLKELPHSRRHGEQLATLIPREELEHDMVLPNEIEQRFLRIESEFAARERLGAYGLRPRKTILLHGPPGCGKSLGAKRIAWNTGLPLMKVRFDALISSYFGESAQNLRNIFHDAKERPCVLLLDECDFIARSRTDSKDIGEASRIVNSLLQLMEEYDAPGLLVATTNIQASLDEAIFRRFDDVFLVPLPSTAEIKELLHMTLSALPIDKNINWSDMVNELSGCSAAMVVKAARDAAKAAILNGGKKVTKAHLHYAIEEAKKHNSN